MSAFFKMTRPESNRKGPLAVSIAFSILSSIAIMNGQALADEKPRAEVDKPQVSLSAEEFTLKAIDNTLRVERVCPPPHLEAGAIRSRFGNTLEFGIGIWTPQSLPAKSHLFTRYTCDRPF